MHVSCACDRREHARMDGGLLHDYMHGNRLHVSSEVDMVVTSAFVTCFARVVTTVDC
jgi:hypothetical protein